MNTRMMFVLADAEANAIRLVAEALDFDSSNVI